MRSLIWSVLVLLLLIGGFITYRTLQPPVGSIVDHGDKSLIVATKPTTQGSRAGIGAGTGIWVERHDPKTGRLQDRFRGMRYSRQLQGTLAVEQPEAEFFLDQGRVLRISGKRGTVVVQEGVPTRKKGILSESADAPTQGDLRDVTLRLFESEDAPKPTLTVSMDNATFDTQSNRIFTEATEINGKHVEHNEVPVIIRGEDYDYDGRGLTVRWDQKEKKLELLEIAHGNQLLIKNPKHAMEQQKGEQGGATPPSTSSPASAPAPAAAPVSPAPTSKPGKPGKIENPRGKQVYRASFQQNVHVIQGDQDLVHADEMQVEFAAEGSDEVAGGNKKASTKPEPASVAATPATAVPPAANVPAPSPKPSSDNGMALSNEPIRITWTGRMTVMPVAAPATQGDIIADEHGQVVRMIGSPVVIHQKDTEIHGTTLVYGTADERLIGHGSPGAPLVMKSSDGGLVETDSIEYVRRNGRAVLTGNGHVNKPLKAAEGQPAEVLQTWWTKSCVLSFSGDSEQTMVMRDANLEGDVRVEHPQLKLNSQKLLLGFAEQPKVAAAPATNPSAVQTALKEVHAQGNVHAEVHQADGKSQTMECQDLTMTTAQTPDGKFYADKLVADGAVHAFDPDQQQLRTEHLVALMDPAPAKIGASTQSTGGVPMAEAQPRSIVADGGVHIEGRDGMSADARKLEVAFEPGQQQPKLVRMTGQPARVVKGPNITIGDIIEMNPGTQQFDIKSPGSMHLVREDGGNSPPVDVAWQGNVQALLKDNIINVVKDIVVTTTGSDQSLSTVRSQNLKLTLADKPSAKLHAGDQPATRKQGGVFTDAGASGDVMGDKEPRRLELSGDDKHEVQVQNVRGDDAGNLLRQFELRSRRVNYDIPAQKLIIPVPGKLLLYDNQKPDAKSATRKSSDPIANMSSGDNRGTSAMKWEGELVYDQLVGRIVINKDVLVRHESVDSSQAPIELQAGRVTVNLLKTGDKSQPVAPGTDQISVRRMVAEEAVQFVGKNIRFLASSAEYSPETGVFIAKGTDRVPATLLDDQNATKGTFKEIHWNMRTQQIDSMTGFQAAIRQAK